MHETIWLSCPRTLEGQQLLTFAERQNWLTVAGIGESLCGSLPLQGEHIFTGSSHPLLFPHWQDGSDGGASDGLAAQQALSAAAAKTSGMSVVTAGPLTDLARALLADPALSQRLGRILILGGSDSIGDVTPAAERNFYRDPEAAQVVMKSGVPIVLFALNTTRTLPDHVLAPLCYLHSPALFQTEPAGVFVETRGSCTRGKTVNDLYSDKQFPEKNVLFVTGIDAAGFAAFVREHSA